MGEIFKLKNNNMLVGEKYKINPQVSSWNQVPFGGKCVKVFGAKIWNYLQCHIE